MKPFLEVVARQYAAHYGNRIADICFVFPNKRSGTFFMKHLRDEKGRANFFMPPTIRTFSSLAEEISGRVVDNRIALLFRLFNCYKRLSRLPDGDKRLEFDRFRSWGEMVLNDFEDVDRSGANPDEIFKNVKDLGEIETDYLTDEQEKVLEDVFGFEPMRHAGRFWKKFFNEPFSEEVDEEGQGPINVRGHFVHLWRMMAPLYHNFNESLEKDGMAYQGHAYKLTAEKIKGGEPLPYKKFVFIGFYNILPLEENIFRIMARRQSELGDEPLADFVWDFTGPASSDERNVELEFMRQNIANFPKPAWLDLDESNSYSLPEETVLTACPSNSLQAKQVGDIIGEMTKDADNLKLLKNAKVAVVLPDENLLLPLLYSLPENLSDASVSINLTMGYPMRLTAAATFVALLRNLQRNSRKADGASFYHEDVKKLLCHPYMSLLAGADAIAGARDFMERYNGFTVPASLLCPFAEAMGLVFRRVDSSQGAQGAFAYLRSIFLRCFEQCRKPGVGDGSISLEKQDMATYIDALVRLKNAVDKYGIAMRASTFLTLADRILATEKVSFIGEPVSGLQIVGLLETRCLDFDRIIVPSMNERIFPQRYRSKSFIPASLRHAYGLPTKEQKERAFTYIFYRMISRAGHVHLLWDTRSSGKRQGDPSRYVQQLKYLYLPSDKMREREVRYTVQSRERKMFSIPHNKDIDERLDAYFSSQEETRKKISPTLLQKYIKCPMLFYYTGVLGLPDNPEPSEFMNDAEIGQVFHSVMQNVYLPNIYTHGQLLSDNPPTIDAAYIDRWLANDCHKLKCLLRKCLWWQRHHRKPAEGERDGYLEQLEAPMLVQLKATLLHDRGLTPFRIYGCEIKAEYKMPLPNGRKVNMKLVVDRLDMIAVDGVPTMRIVDYKSGSAHLHSTTIPALFKSLDKKYYESQNLFQLLSYAMGLREVFPELVPPWAKGLRMEIYSPLISQKKPAINVLPSVIIEETDGKTREETLLLDTDVAGEFREHLTAMIQMIFDSEEPFTQTSDATRCDMCNFRELCNSSRSF